MSKSSKAIATIDDDSGPSGALERTLRVLELLAAHAHGMQLFEVAETLRIPRSATHRILTSLADLGYVRQPREQGAYQLTAKIASLAFAFLSGSGITDLAQPILDRLARETGELVRLALVDGRELVWVAKAQGSQFGLRYDPDMGRVGRLSCTASGHAWLACLSDADALLLVEKQGYGLRKDYGPRAPESKAALLKALRETRKRGYSLAIQTYAPWMNSAAAAVFDPATRDVAGTVVIAGPNMRLTEDRITHFAPHLMDAARELSVAIAASPSLGRPRGNNGSFFISNAT
jgi:DNA-binding IclR family transcriptional regulator